MSFLSLFAVAAAFVSGGDGTILWEHFGNPYGVYTTTNRVGNTVFEMDSDFPERPGIGLHVLEPGNLKTLKVRIPRWVDLAKNGSIRVNGTYGDFVPDADGFVSISREWKYDDRVILSFRGTARRVDAGDGKVEVRRGDVIYVADGDSLADDVTFVVRREKVGDRFWQVLDSSDGRVFSPVELGRKGNTRFRRIPAEPKPVLELETVAIQRRIDEAAANGGGRVTIGPGVHKSGTIYLKSGVELHLEKGAVLLASDNLDDYNALDAFPQNGKAYVREGWQAKHLIICLEQENVSITGEGTIDGNGRAFFEDSIFQTIGKEGWRDGGLNSRDFRRSARPGQLVEFCESRNVRVEGVTFVDPPAWTLFFHGCENVKVEGIRVDGDTRRMNTDGIDIDSCRHVRVSNCRIRTGDDAIAIRGAPARLKDKTRACEDVVVEDIVAEVSASGCRIGVGFGVIRNVRISGFKVKKAGHGFLVHSAYRGNGGAEISDIVLSDAELLDTSVAIEIEGSNGKRPRNIRFENVLVERTDYVPGDMVRVENADNIDLEGVRYIDDVVQAVIDNGVTCQSAAEQSVEAMNILYRSGSHKPVYRAYPKVKRLAMSAGEGASADDDPLSLVKRYRFIDRMRKFAATYGAVSDAEALREQQDLVVAAYAARMKPAGGNAEPALGREAASLSGMYAMPLKHRPVIALIPKPAELTERPGTLTVWGQEVSERLAVCREDRSLPPEGYVLRVAEGGIEIEASTPAGRFYAVQTLKQLAVKNNDDTLTFPCVEIRDRPRFGWRGVMLDESRHFFGKGAVRRLLDVMSLYKFNVFHWHLTDNQGWRFPVLKRPEVAQRASTRPASQNHCNLADSVEDCDYGPFHYSERDIREVVAYAAARHIRIVPEIDVPGHCAAIVKAFPELGCGGSVDNVLCVGNPATRAFLDDVFDSVLELFPGEVVHIGCDEVNMKGWRECAKCRAFMKSEGLADEKALQAWTISHIASRLAKRGRRIVGWDEMVFDGKIPEGGIVMEWRDGMHGGAEAVRKGHRCVLTPWSSSYFIGRQELRDGDPFHYGGPQWYGPSLSLKKAYSYDPLTKIPENGHHLVLGGQCCNWTESTVCEAELQWKMWPRAFATSEIYWSYPSERDYADFRRRVELHRPRLFGMHINCAPIGE